MCGPSHFIPPENDFCPNPKNSARSVSSTFGKIDNGGSVLTRTTIKTLDLFSGAGGMSLGFQDAGFRPLAAFEVDEDAAKTYEANLQDSAVQCRDIREISFKKYKGAVDVLIGGPPCQPFSRGGYQNSFLDTRDMLPEFLRAVSEVNPKSFVLENVPGLISPIVATVRERVENTAGCD
jgi:site-specific DNA-cytosine methylase